MLNTTQFIISKQHYLDRLFDSNGLLNMPKLVFYTSFFSLLASLISIHYLKLIQKLSFQVVFDCNILSYTGQQN